MIAPQDTDDVHGTVCPKQPWVMLTFSDDEALVPGAALPPGLRFHLSRCASCRAVAEKLSGVTTALDGAASESPPDDLVGQAAAQARSVLRDGARLSGRVHIEDEPPVVERLKEGPFGLPSRSVSAWIAMAACIGLVFVLAAGWRFGFGSGRHEQRSGIFDVEHPVSSGRWNLVNSGRDRDVDGAPVDADQSRTANNDSVDDSADSSVEYVLLRDEAQSAQHARKAVNPPPVWNPRNGFMAPPPTHLLDKTEPTVSTVNSTKDR